MKYILLCLIVSFSSLIFSQTKNANMPETKAKYGAKMDELNKNLSRAEYKELKKNGKLIEGVEYYIKDAGVSNPSLYRGAGGSGGGLTPSSLSVCDVWPVTGTMGYTVETDDSPLLTIPIPFNFCFYGTNYTSLNLSVNGNVQFSSNSTSFSSTGFPSTTVNMIAPFWSDAESMVVNGGVTFGKIYIDPHPTYMIISWDSMGYFNNHTDKLNSFQLVITNGLDPILPPGKNVGFYYRQMQWTTGDASSGTNGFPTTQPGTPATVGINQGNGIDYFLIGRFGVPGSIYDGPLGNSDGISWLNGKRFYFNVCPPTGANIEPISTLIGYCDTMKVCGDDTLIIKNAFIGPELTQSVTVTAVAPTLAGSFAYLAVPNGNNTDISMIVNGATASNGDHVVTMTATDNGTPALTSQQSFIVHVDHTIPNPLNGHIILTPTIGICPGGAATGSIVVTGASPSSYLWNNNAATTSTSFSLTSTLDSLVYVTIKNGQCTKTIKNYIHVNPVPVATITANSMLLCAGSTNSTTILTASNTLNYSAQGPYTYSWSPTAPATQTRVASGGTYVVQITNQYNCKSTASITINSQSAPAFSVSPTNTLICGASAIVPFTVTLGPSNPTSCGLATSGCGSTNTRTLGTGSSTNGSSSFPTPYSNYYKSQHFQMLFTAAELNAAGVTPGKINSLTFNISTLNSFNVALPNYTIKMKCTSATTATSFDNTGLSQVYFASTYMPTTGLNTHNFSQSYEWSGTTNLLIDICYDRIPTAYVSSGSAGAFYSTTGFTSVIYDYSDSQDMCSSSSFPSTSSNRPNVRFGNCTSAVDPSTLSYNWAPSTGLNDATLQNPIATVSQGVSVYSVSVISSLLPTCYITKSATITVINPITPTISVAGPYCDNFAPQTMTVIPTSTLGVWSSPTSPTAINSSGLFSPSLATIGNSILNYSVSAGACSVSASIAVNVVKFIPATITGGVGPYCIYDAMENLQSTAQYTGGVWSGNGVTGSDFTPSLAGAGTHVVTYSTNPLPLGLCPDSKTLSILVNAKPQANALANQLSGCVPLEVNLYSSTVNTGNATWSFGDGTTATGLTANHIYTVAGTYSASISYTDAIGCVNDSAVANSFTVYANPLASFEPSLYETTVVDAQLEFTNHSTTPNTNSYVWDISGLATFSTTNSSYLFTDAGTYTISLTATTLNNCVDDTSVVIVVKPDVVLYVPNAFTPGNADNLNDVFQIFLPPTGVDYTTFSLNIYDRWGVKVYYTNDVTKSWNGSKNNTGDILKEGVYVWKISFKDANKKLYEKVGHVTLLPQQ